MELIYLYHSGFALLGTDYTLVFDFYEDTVSETDGLLHQELLNRPGRLYVFSSHAHADHFNPQIMKWRLHRPDIVYIFSSDIREVYPEAPSEVNFLEKGQEYSDDILKVRATGSTDVGVSFLLYIDGKTVFHAGDLNNWHWMEESDEAEWRGYENCYLRELTEIAKLAPSIEIVLFPADPRLGKEYLRGARQWLESIRVKWFVPMHFDEDYETAGAVSELAAHYGTQCFVPGFRGDRREIG